MTGRTIQELAVGDAAEVTHTITADVIREFVKATGDGNPIHSDARFAASTRFGRMIAPGMLTGSLVSGVIGTQLPGPGTIYLSQSLRFLRPVYIGDRVTARVEVAERLVEKNRLRLTTTCVNQNGEVLLEGEAWVLPSQVRVEYDGSYIPESAWNWNTLACAPAALTVELMALWMSSGFALANQAFQLYRRNAIRST